MSNFIDTNQLCLGCMTRVENKQAPCPHCGWQDDTAERSAHQLPPQIILNGKYLVGRVLGEGGFGITYLGWDLNLDMKVAIKEYYPSGFVTRETTTTTTVTPFSGDKHEAYFNGLDKFVGEAKSLAKFYSLRSIVSVKDFFKENGTGYIVMEYVEGITLKQYLTKEGGKLPVYQVLEWVKPLIKSLTQMHEKGIIHRDISPDNIMITPGGEIKLLDFGAARDISTDGAKSLSVLLKPGYAPEEQYRTRGIQGPWTDVYALCATIYKAITGKTPPESMERIHEDTLEPPTKLGVNLNQVKEAALLKGLAILQKNRYQNMSELYEALIASELLKDTPEADDHAEAHAYSKMPILKEEKKKTLESSPHPELQLKLRRTTGSIIAAVILLALGILVGNRFMNKHEGSPSDLQLSPTVTKEAILDTPAAKPSETPLETPSETPNKPQKTVIPNTAGNTEGNIIYGGRVTSQDGTVYYGDMGRVYVKDADDAPSDLFYESSYVEDLNVVGDKIYFINDYYSIYYADLNTGIYVEVPDSTNPVNLFVKNNKIYYLNNFGPETWGLYCMDPDGTNKLRLTNPTIMEDLPKVYFVMDDWIYYNTESAKLFKVRLDGTENTQIEGIYADVFIIDDSWIYYSVSSNHNFKRARLDGSGASLFSNRCIDDLNSFGDWLFFTDEEEQNSLYAIKKDGTGEIKLCSDNAHGIYIVDDWIYYYNWDDNYNLYRIRFDGSERQQYK